MKFKAFYSLTEDVRMICEWCEKWNIRVDPTDDISRGFAKFQRNFFERIYQMHYESTPRDRAMLEIVTKYAKKIREHIFCPRYREDKRFDRIMMKYAHNQEDDECRAYEVEVAQELINEL